MQFPNLFQLTSAFAFWAGTGFKGRCKDDLEKNSFARRQPAYKAAYFGAVIYVVAVMCSYSLFGK